MKNVYLTILLSTIAASAVAAAPPGHPSPAVAAEMLAPTKPAKPAELPHEGKVVSFIHANEYTYIEVSSANATRWLAAPQTALKTGNLIRYEEGSTMTNFYSKMLKRTFPSVMFIGQLAIVAEK
jgi:hypothetical protein